MRNCCSVKVTPVLPGTPCEHLTGCRYGHVERNSYEFPKNNLSFFELWNWCPPKSILSNLGNRSHVRPGSSMELVKRLIRHQMSLMVVQKCPSDTCGQPYGSRKSLEEARPMWRGADEKTLCLKSRVLFPNGSSYAYFLFLIDVLKICLLRVLLQKLVPLHHVTSSCHHRIPAWGQKRHHFSKHCKFRRKFLVEQ